VLLAIRIGLWILSLVGELIRVRFGRRQAQS
jgi:hypothetical protein